ncbi:probable glutamate carboxypeptidase LAMP1 isoform X1 [Tanacetum coccineum]
MVSKMITAIIALTSTISFLFISSPSKSYYHKLYISPSLSDNASISHHLYTLTRRPHLAQYVPNRHAASYVLSTLSANNIKSHLAEYAVLLTYPDSRSLTLIRPSPEPPTTFSLKQEVYEGDPYADVADQVEPSFHAYAKSGGYGEIYRGDIIENAYDAGAIGVLIYSDRKDYGGAGGDTKWFPDDKWLPPSGVQVGTVFNGAGDPSTPGWPSNIEGCERLSEDEVEKEGDVSRYKDAPVYRVGPGPGIIGLTYKAKQVISTIQNVIGIIEGAEEPDSLDVDKGGNLNSITYALEFKVAERLEKLRKQGWKPRRSIIFCNWDAEEYGLVGSTEWVEENREMLSSKVVAYLNVDIAVSGAGFQASATPQLDQLIAEATKQCSFYVNLYVGLHSASLTPIFLTSYNYPLSPRTKDSERYPVYHSMYDDFVWMRDFGDPMFRRHAAAASIWGLVALQLADEEILPFNYELYVYEIQEIKDNKGWALIWKDQPWKLRGMNDRLMMAERALTDREGLSGRPWYKHCIYAPSKHNRYGSKCFPGIDDALENAKSLNTEDSWLSVQHEIWRVSRVVTQASLVLRGELT